MIYAVETLSIINFICLSMNTLYKPCIWGDLEQKSLADCFNLEVNGCCGHPATLCLQWQWFSCSSLNGNGHSKSVSCYPCKFPLLWYNFFCPSRILSYKAFSHYESPVFFICCCFSLLICRTFSELSLDIIEENLFLRSFLTYACPYICWRF